MIPVGPIEFSAGIELTSGNERRFSVVRGSRCTGGDRIFDAEIGHRAQASEPHPLAVHVARPVVR
jgi:hypothetical protein